MNNLIDINNTLDLVKFKFYNEYLYTNHIYDEGESGFHKELTKQVVEKYIDPLKIPTNTVILDLGCGPGYFLDEMKSRGYSNLTGVTLSPGDTELCKNKGHTVKGYDLSFLPQKDGYYDESVDFIFLRHALEHSPYPVISLMEYNRVLKQNGLLYIEVPAPECDRKHEYNLNHYSILGKDMLLALLQRTGFTVHTMDSIKFTLKMPTEGNNYKEVEEHYYVILATKTQPLDVK